MIRRGTRLEPVAGFIDPQTEIAGARLSKIKTTLARGLRPRRPGSRILIIEQRKRASPAASAMAYRYAFLRAKTDLRYAETALDSLSKAIGFKVELLTLTRRSPTWKDGLVVRFAADEGPLELALRWRSALSEFDAWAIHNAHGDCAEILKGGPMDMAFKAVASQGKQGVSQLFLAFRHKEHNSALATSRLRASLPLKAENAFRFQDGCVLFLDTHESAATTQRRLENWKLPLYWCCVCDANHETLVLTPNAGRCWTMVSLDELVVSRADDPYRRSVRVDYRHQS